MSKRTPELLLGDILDSAEKIISYTDTLTFDDFSLDSKTIDAVVRNIEIIGEASNRLPDEFKDASPGIDWHKIRGLRNRIAHEYFGMNYAIIWSVKEDYLPGLIKQVKLLLNNI
ncbi:DUF86 domain-containing protein [Mucilaginibacter terrigena]|uniref:DUF86 domain-containing protein n=1 Tax=Mucilaginibacter terrigena TaxID=2492395 RepID=A0A4Q5LNB9_9SPHI|nr:DUF86 domain-containing protein [Mucilaginibacter terrigena]RYU90865.1 DUF86 domain-containing protein [Mucilaginibacter terrigena]